MFQRQRKFRSYTYGLSRFSHQTFFKCVCLVLWVVFITLGAHLREEGKSCRLGFILGFWGWFWVFLLLWFFFCWFIVIVEFFNTILLQEDEPQEDAKELQQGKPYHWRDWSIIRGRDCLYIWSDAAALELSNGSNGWFRFILDGKLATMYSSGSPEGGSDSSGSFFIIQVQVKC